MTSQPAGRTSSAVKFQLYKQVGLTPDIREDGLRKGDIGIVVDHLRSSEPGGQEGYSLEVFNALGETIVVTAVPESAIEVLREDHALTVRAIAKTG